MLADMLLDFRFQAQDFRQKRDHVAFQQTHSYASLRKQASALPQAHMASMQ